MSLKMERTQHGQPLEMARIKELSLLKDGWLDGEGKALPREGLAWLAEMVAQHFSNGAAKLYIYPMPEGGATLEWQGGDEVRHSASLEIDLNARRGEWVAANTEQGKHEDLDLSSDAGWKRLLKLMRTLNSISSRSSNWQGQRKG